MGQGGGQRSQENKRNSEGKNYREDIFAAVYLKKPSGWEKQFPTISKLIKGLQFISVSKTNTLTEDGREEGEEKGGGRPISFLSFSTPTSHLL